MKKILNVGCLAGLMFVHLSIASGTQNRSLDAVLPGLSAHIRQNLDALPGLVCEERMSWAGHVAVSDYKPLRNDSPLGYQVVETRNVKSIDGQAVGKDGNKQGLPRFNGVATSLTVALLPDNYLFSIHGADVVDSTPTLIVEFETKPDVRERTMAYASGKAWVDPKSLQVLRLEERSSHEGRTVFQSIDYSKFETDGKTFWAPKTIKSEVLEGARIMNGFNGDYTAEYRDCRRSDK